MRHDLIITLNISLIPVIKLIPCSGAVGRMKSTTRTNWTANINIPDSIITNMICRNLVPPVEPKDRSIEVVAALTSKNTLRILNTIKPVTRTFTAIDAAKLAVDTGLPQAVVINMPCTNVVAAIGTSQVTSER